MKEENKTRNIDIYYQELATKIKQIKKEIKKKKEDKKYLNEEIIVLSETFEKNNFEKEVF